MKEDLKKDKKETIGFQGEWELTHLERETADTQIGISMHFEEDEMRVSGSAGCNRYFGRYTIGKDGKSIQFGETAVTRMMCPPEIMKWEDAFLLAFTQVTHYEISDNELFLKQGRNVLIRARKLDK